MNTDKVKMYLLFFLGEFQFLPVASMFLAISNEPLFHYIKVI